MASTLGQPTVTNNKSVQMAIRRLLSAGAKAPAEDRLVDLMIAGEAIFIRHAGLGSTNQKKQHIVNGATLLLQNDPELNSSADQIRTFLDHAYRRRNHDVHADPNPPQPSRLLSGTQADDLDATVNDLERLMRRAITLTVQHLGGQTD